LSLCPYLGYGGFSGACVPLYALLPSALGRALKTSATSYFFLDF